MVEKKKKKKKGIWKDVVNQTNEDFEGRLKQVSVGIKGILGKQAGEADTRTATLIRFKTKVAHIR